MFQLAEPFQKTFSQIPMAGRKIRNDGVRDTLSILFFQRQRSLDDSGMLLFCSKSQEPKNDSVLIGIKPDLGSADVDRFCTKARECFASCLSGYFL